MELNLEGVVVNVKPVASLNFFLFPSKHYIFIPFSLWHENIMILTSNILPIYGFILLLTKV